MVWAGFWQLGRYHHRQDFKAQVLARMLRDAQQPGAARLVGAEERVRALKVGVLRIGHGRADRGEERPVQVVRHDDAGEPLDAAGAASASDAARPSVCCSPTLILSK